MPRQLASISLVIISVFFALGANAKGLRPSVIYGQDDRLDYYQVDDTNWTARADSTFALVRASNLEASGETTRIKTVAYGQSMGLCLDEPFYNQETAAFCSGFLLTPDTLVTAGHCIRTQESCASTKFVLGFRLDSANSQPRSVSTDAVYSCQTLVHSVALASGEDFAVVKLDRNVTQVAPLSYRKAGSINVGESLVVIGHPVGLPTKISGGAKVRTMLPQYLVANLDTYGGNSGSAVFNGLTGEVEGILVRGEADFKFENGCRRSNVCTDSGCRGEDVTLIERVLSYLPAN